MNSKVNGSCIPLMRAKSGPQTNIKANYLAFSSVGLGFFHKLLVLPRSRFTVGTESILGCWNEYTKLVKLHSDIFWNQSTSL